MASNLSLCNDMSTPSSWPLPPSSIRYLVPKPMIDLLHVDILSSGLYPLAFGYYEEAFGHKLVREQHDDHLMMFCIQGKGQIKTSNWQGELLPNQMVFIPKGTPHEYQADLHKPWSIYWIHLSGHLFEHYMDIIGNKQEQLIVTLSKPELIEMEFKQLMETRLQGYHINSFICAAAIMKKILSLVASQHPGSVNTANKDFNKQKFDLYLKEHVCDVLSLDDMAKFVGLSKYYFAKKFQLVTGISPVKYFLEMKIRYACLQLDSSQASIKDVAKHLGYEDPYYFSRLFKNIMGLSPKQYRLSKHGH